MTYHPPLPVIAPNLGQISKRIRSTVANMAAHSLAHLVALFRPLQHWTDLETHIEPDGAEVEIEVRTPAILVDSIQGVSIAHLDAWIERGEGESCVHLRLLGYWVEVYYLSKPKST